VIVGFLTRFRKPGASQDLVDMLAFPWTIAGIAPLQPEAAAVLVPDPAPISSVPFWIVRVHGTSFCYYNMKASPFGKWKMHKT